MFDQTNQTEQTQAMPEKLFDGEKTTPAAEESGTLTVKYNGEEKKISLEEAAVLAQKGMNYDHVVAERDSKYKRELDVLERYASLSGMSRQEYVNRLEEEARSDEIRAAYQSRIAYLTDKVSSLESRERAAAKSMGSGTSLAAQEPRDAFLEGFM